MAIDEALDLELSHEGRKEVRKYDRRLSFLAISSQLPPFLLYGRKVGHERVMDDTDKTGSEMDTEALQSPDP